MRRFKSYCWNDVIKGGVGKFVIRSVIEDRLLRNAAKALDKIIQGGTSVPIDCWQAWAEIVGPSTANPRDEHGN